MRAGQIQVLPSLGGGTFPTAINNSGQVVGSSWASGSSIEQAVLISGGSVQVLGTLGTLPNSTAVSINNLGQIAGYACQDPSVPTASGFFYSGGKMQDVGALFGAPNTTWPAGINDAAQIVGVSNGHAFLYAGGTMQDLQTLGGLDSDATAINNAGQIVGSSLITGNNASACLLVRGRHDARPGDTRRIARRQRSHGHQQYRPNRRVFLLQNGDSSRVRLQHRNHAGFEFSDSSRYRMERLNAPPISTTLARSSDMALTPPAKPTPSS